MTGDFTIDDVFATAKLPQQSVPVCLRGDLVAEWQDLERQFTAAQSEDDSLASSSAVDLAKQMSIVQEQMRAATRDFQLTALGRTKWNELLKAHPPREDDQTDFNRETFPAAAIAACCTMPVMTVEQACRLADEALTQGQWDTLFAHVWVMNSSTVDVPFSLAASATLAGTEPSQR